MQHCSAKTFLQFDAANRSINILQKEKRSPSWSEIEHNKTGTKTYHQPFDAQTSERSEH